MAWIVCTVLFLLIAFSLLIAARRMKKRGASEGGSDDSYTKTGSRVMQGIAGALVFMVVVWTLVASIHIVKAGHVGVVYQFGSIVGQTGEGAVGTAPWQGFRSVSVQVEKVKFENIMCFSQETQDVIVSATVNISVSSGKVQELYTNVGPNWQEKLLEARVMNFFKEETVGYETVKIAPNREKIRVNVKQRLATDLAKYSITVVDLLIDNIDFNPEFKLAIEQKQIATQDALREKERVEQKKNEALQLVETAKGEATATRERANGQGDANKTLNASLTPSVLQYLAIQKFGDDVKFVFLPAGNGLLLDPSALMGLIPKTGN